MNRVTIFLAVVAIAAVRGNEMPELDLADELLASAELQHHDVQPARVGWITDPEKFAVTDGDLKIINKWTGFTGNSLEPTAIALDVAGKQAYYITNRAPRMIRRTSFADGASEDLVTDSHLGDKSGPVLGSGLALDVADGKMYWVATSKKRVVEKSGRVTLGPDTVSKIWRANLDGTGIQLVTSIDGRGTSIRSIALDLGGRKIYWAQFTMSQIPGSSRWTGHSKISSANLDGSGVQDVVTEQQVKDQRGTTRWNNKVDNIALDVAGGKVYWTEGIVAGISRASLDGSNVETIVQTGNIPDIALDLAAGKIYWIGGAPGALGAGYAKPELSTLRRANLDGSSVETVLDNQGTVSGSTRVGYLGASIALDVAGGEVYWTQKNGWIKRFKGIRTAPTHGQAASPCDSSEACRVALNKAVFEAGTDETLTAAAWAEYTTCIQGTH